MYDLNKLLDKEETHVLFKTISQLTTVKPWLAVIDTRGKILVQHPEQTTPPDQLDGCAYSPLILNDICLGNLVGKNHEMESLSALLVLLNTLLIKQIKDKFEKKELLHETLDTYKEINLLYTIGYGLSACLDVEGLAKTLLEEINKIIRAENSSLMLINPKTSQLEIKSAIGQKSGQLMEMRLGQGIAGIVAQESKAIICNDISQEPRFIPGEKNIISLLCAPLTTRQTTLGVINVSNKMGGDIFTARDAKLLCAIASQAANFIENAILYERKLNEDRLRQNLERYMPPHILTALIENKRELELGGERKKVAILFADIRKFTSLSEEMEPETLVSFLNEYFTHMVDVVFKHGGTIDKFVGDEIIAVFGAPISQPDDELRAIKTAIEMQQEMKRLQEEHWRRKNMPPFEIGIGINAGEVITGNIGSKKHMDYTVIGDVVNVAKRLESQAAGGKILVTKAIYEIGNHLFEFKDFGKILVKGKKKPIQVYEIVY